MQREIGKILASVEVSDVHARIIGAVAILGLISVLLGQPDVVVSQKIFKRSITLKLKCEEHRRCSMRLIKVDTNPPANYESRSITVNWYGAINGDMAFMIYAPDSLKQSMHARITLSNQTISVSKYP